MTWNKTKIFFLRLIFILACMLQIATAHAQSIRIGTHPNEDFIRIAFDWSTITGYRLSAQTENTLLINFSRDGEFKIPALSNPMRQYLISIRQTAPNQIQLKLPENITFNPFRYNNSVIIDLRAGDFSETAKRLTGAPPQPPGGTQTESRALRAQTDNATDNGNAILDGSGTPVGVAKDNDASDVSGGALDDLSDVTISKPDRQQSEKVGLEVIDINTYSLQERGGRIEFVWSEAPQFVARIENNSLIVSFDRPFTTDDLSTVEPSFSFAIGPAILIEDSRTFSLPITGKLVIASRRTKNKVLIDILQRDKSNLFDSNNLPDEAVIGAGDANSNIISGYEDLPFLDDDAPIADNDAQKNGIANDDDTAQNKVRVGRTADYTRLIFDFTDDIQYLIEHKDNKELRINFGFNQPLDISQLKFEKDEPFANPRVFLADNVTTFFLDVPDSYNIRHFRSGAKVVVDFLPKERRGQKKVASA